MAQRIGRRLLLFPAPLEGHINPMLQLAFILHTKGFSITIIHTHFNSPDSSFYPQFKFEPISDGLLPEEAAKKVDFKSSLVQMMQFNQSCVEPFRDCMSKLLAEEDEEEPVACLITDIVWPFTQAVADSHKLARLVFRADSQLALPILDRPPMIDKDMATIFAKNKEAFSKFIASMKKETNAALGMIWNSFKELEQPHLPTIQSEFPSNLHYLIGPMHKYSPPSSKTRHDSISWLDSQAPKSVVFVSFGSSVALDEVEFKEMAWGLANSEQPFLWVVRPGSVRGFEWLETLPDGFLDALGQRGHMIVKCAPQQEVLAHPATGCFWTRNGWIPTLEAICEGVPMICSPSFADQFVNAKYVNDYWRVGVELENGFERGEIEKAIKRVMVDKEGEEMRDRVMCLKEKAENCVKEGGSSFKSLKGLVDHILSFK